MNQPPLNPDGIEKAYEEYGWSGRLEIAIRAYLAAAQPELQANSKPNQNFEVVKSVEELDQLPMHSYVQGNDGFKHAKDWDGGWHLIVNRPSSAPHLSGSIELPALVLYRPEVKP